MTHVMVSEDRATYSIIDGDTVEDFVAGTGESLGVRRATAEELAAVAAEVERVAEHEAGVAALAAHRDALADARGILLEYRFGAPGTPSFPEVLSPVQTAVLDYRDSGVRDPECDEHIMWINARVNEINAAALYGAGVLK